MNTVLLNNRKSGIRIDNKIISNLIILLFISSALIFLEFSGLSSSLLFGSFLLFSSILQRQSLLKIKGFIIYLLLFVFSVLLSLVYSEIPLSYGHFKLSVQLIYWFILALIVYNSYEFVSKELISRFLFFIVFIVMALYAMGYKVGTQNSIAYTAIIFAPLGFFYIKRLSFRVVFGIVLVYLLLLNGSRTGAIISVIQCLFIVVLSIDSLRKYGKSIVIVSVSAALLVQSDAILGSLGRFVLPYNEELGDLMIDTEFVLNNDLSWLQRKAQVQKGLQIFDEHPVLGIGFSNFVQYKVVIDEKAVGGDRYLKGIENRSAHNSYIEILSETGAIGFFLWAFFLLGMLVNFWRNFEFIIGTFEIYIFISLVGMLIYFYTISAHLGTSTWIMLGLCAGAVKKFKLSKSQ